MVKVDIFSGFLGAGKTTLIKKLIKEAYAGEKLVLVENEFGEIGVDGTFMQDAGITVNELNSGCICCSLVGDFSKALKQVVETYHPERILIEPSGVGKLSDIIIAVKEAAIEELQLNSFTTVVDATKAKMYIKNFGEFFNNQVENAGCIIFSHTDTASEKKLEEALALVKEHNPTATVILTPWSELSGADILSSMERKDTLEAELERLRIEQEHEAAHAHCHSHSEEDEECHCHEVGEHHHHHEDGEECHRHEVGEHHHHHEDGEECHCHEEGEHHHHHEDGEECHCGHHHHHADEVFQSWGVQTGKKFSETQLTECLKALAKEENFGIVLRAKGVVPAIEGGFYHFDYVPGTPDIRKGSAAPVGMLCVIGAGLKEEELQTLFGV